MQKPVDFKEYKSAFPKDIQKILVQLREAIKDVAPKAQEVISYGMPALKLNGMLLYYAAHKNHIGLYPMASGIAEFKKELSNYKNARGSVQFPYEKPLPISLIKKIVKFRVAENLQKAKMKKEKLIKVVQ